MYCFKPIHLKSNVSMIEKLLAIAYYQQLTRYQFYVAGTTYYYFQQYQVVSSHFIIHGKCYWAWRYQYRNKACSQRYNILLSFVIYGFQLVAFFLYLTLPSPSHENGTFVTMMKYNTLYYLTWIFLVGIANITTIGLFVSLSNS